MFFSRGQGGFNNQHVWRHQGDVASCHAATPVHHRSPPLLSPWKTQCAQSIQIDWMSIHGMSKHRPSVAMELCWPWSSLWRMWCCTAGARALGIPAVGVAVLIGDDGTARGERYCNARGEILRPLQDQRQRRRSASACSSIKNESVGSEDDQTPS